MKTIKLPFQIEETINQLLSQSNTAEWLKSAVTLSLKYRAERVKQGITYIKDYSDVLGYLALRASSTYGQIYGALSQIQELNPNWKVQSVLDIGSGPGTATWAAVEIFPDLTQVSLIEKDKNFIEVGKKIMSSFTKIETHWESKDLTFSSSHINNKFDLVILGNALNEMDDTTRRKTIEFAFKHCQGILLVIEPGTPYGTHSIDQSITELANYKKLIIAPFIDNSCVSSENIIFSQRIIRPDFQKRVRQQQRKNELIDKSKILPPSDWEDSTFSYIAYSKFTPEILPTARLLKNPQLFKPFIELHLLTKEGIKIDRIFKKDRQKFKQAKKLLLGEIL